MLKVIKDITLNDTKNFFLALLFTSMSELVRFGSIFIVLWFSIVMLEPFVSGVDSIESTSLWIIVCIGFVYMILCYLVEIPAFHYTYTKAYEESAKGRLRLAKHVSLLPLGFLQSNNPARISHTIMKDFGNLEQANTHLLPQMFSSLVVSLVVFIALVCYHWQMALAFFICIPFAFVIVICMRKISDSLALKHRDSILEASNRINEYIDGITTIKAYNLSGEKFIKLEESFEALRKASIRIEVGIMPFALAILSCMGAGIGIMIFVGRTFLLDGSLSVLEYLGFILIASRAFVPLMTCSINFIELQYFAKSGEHILSLLHEKEVSGIDREIPQSNNIIIKDLDFAYDKKYVLKNINLTFKEKTSTAIVGISGSGKSTLVKLLARFYEPQHGSIEIGDSKNGYKNIATLEMQEFMKKFSMVFQDVYLFSGSIESNVALGKENANKQEIDLALQKANALDFVRELPQGIQSHVAESGNTLSGGEKQRISIARFLLKDSPIVLLDEITSSLDIYNEFALQKAINELAESKTLIIIAHKLKTITQCDNIVVLKHGEIIEQGRHDTLLAQNGEYAKMWNMQNGL